MPKEKEGAAAPGKAGLNLSGPLYDVFKVTLQIDGRIYGGVPKSKDLIQKWVDEGLKLPQSKAEKEMVQMGLDPEELEAAADEKIEGVWTGFRTHDDRGKFIGPHILGRHIRALLKEVGTTLGLFATAKGTKPAVQLGVDIEPQNILLKRGGTVISKEDGTYEGPVDVIPDTDGVYEGPIHVDGPQGKRTALKKRDFALDVELEFFVLAVCRVDGKKYITEELLRKLFLVGQRTPGLGTDRTQGAGKYVLKELREAPEFHMKKYGI